MELSQEQIRRLAYQIWEAGGRRPDSEEENWRSAEQQLRDRHQEDGEALQATPHESMIDESVKESFPASDPPASHAPDIEPVNAEAKWAAARAATQAQQSEASPGQSSREANKRTQRKR